MLFELSIRYYQSIIVSDIVANALKNTLFQEVPCEDIVGYSLNHTAAP